MKIRFRASSLVLALLPLACGKLLGEDFSHSETDCWNGTLCSPSNAAGLGGSSPFGASGAGAVASDAGSGAAAGKSAGGGGGSGSGAGGNPDAGAGGSSGAGADGNSGAGGSSGAGAGGNSGAGGSSGASASSGASGTAGAPTFPTGCDSDALVIPECTLYATDDQHVSYPTVAVAAASGIGVSSTETYHGGFAIVASKRASSTVVQSYTKDVSDSLWTPWFCFDALRDPLHIAGIALASGYQEFFATTRCGQLQHRVDTGTPAFWLPWQALDLPNATSLVSDVNVSLTSDGGNALFVLDRGRAFWRRRPPDDGSGAYGAWRPIGDATNFVAVTAGLLSDSRLEVFAIDTSGHVSTSAQNTADLDADFGTWLDFGSAALPHVLVDVEAPHSGPTPLEVYAVDSSGALWTRTENSSHAFSAWAAWSGPVPPAGIVALSGAGLRNATGTPLQIAVLTASGAVYTVRRTAGSWDSWREF